MIDSKITAFQLPRMRLSEKWDFELKGVLKELEGAKVFFAAFQDAKDDLKVVHSGLNEELYALGQTVFHRNIEVFDFTKLSVINGEKFRAGELNEGFETMTRAVEYLRIKNSKNLIL